jgi:hypothetical protein
MFCAILGPVKGKGIRNKFKIPGFTAEACTKPKNEIKLGNQKHSVFLGFQKWGFQIRVQN